MCTNEEQFRNRYCQNVFIIVWAILKILINAAIIIGLCMLLNFGFGVTFHTIQYLFLLALVGVVIDVGFKITLIIGTVKVHYTMLATCFYYGIYELVVETLFLAYSTSLGSTSPHYGNNFANIWLTMLSCSPIIMYMIAEVLSVVLVKINMNIIKKNENIRHLYMSPTAPDSSTKPLTSHAV